MVSINLELALRVDQSWYFRLFTLLYSNIYVNMATATNNERELSIVSYVEVEWNLKW
jgi:hypothetical protein